MLLKSSIRLLLAAAFFTSMLACDSSEKRVKECVAKCTEAAEACQKQHQPNCEARGRECGEACEKAAK
jgi:hypothetical protein